tara:strand:- start:353 stop:562 length:210 start_codon:yes stop_codon:yes gene_type:complete
MKIGDKIDFYLFGAIEKGTIYKIDKKEKTVSVRCKGYNYPDIRTFKKLPKKRSDNPSNKSYVPPWYILK